MEKENFSKEIADYLIWPLKLRSYLQGMEDIPEGQAQSINSNYLGKWLSKDGLTKFGSMPEVKELNRVHDEIHQSINRLVNYKKEGHLSHAKHELKRIDPLSKKIIYLLASIERKIH